MPRCESADVDIRRLTWVRAGVGVGSRVRVRVKARVRVRVRVRIRANLQRPQDGGEGTTRADVAGDGALAGDGLDGGVGGLVLEQCALAEELARLVRLRVRVRAGVRVGIRVRARLHVAWGGARAGLRTPRLCLCHAYAYAYAYATPCHAMLRTHAMPCWAAHGTGVRQWGDRGGGVSRALSRVMPLWVMP